VRWRPGEASAFYRGRREAARKGGAAAVNGALHEGGGNAAELRRGEEGCYPVKEGTQPVQFLVMAQEVGGGLAQRDGTRWAAVRSTDVGKEKGERGDASLVGRPGEMGQMANGPVKGKRK
jgi:hypothetical protein